MGNSRHSFTAFNTLFTVDSEYEFVKQLGQGAYGCVVSARHVPSGERYAIKKITNINVKGILTKRCLREIKLLHHFRGHKNITCLYDMDIVFQPNGDFNEVYLFEELMEADLHAIIRSGQPLTDAHHQYFIYQTLCGLKYIHSANVLHRDLKPGNLLVNADCQLKICDFGLARGYTPGGGASGGQGFMTEYVATRWYRAPEIMLSFANYSTSIDIWSVGCILAELLGGQPIFKGKDYMDQLNQILYYLGNPSEEALGRVGSARAQDYIRTLPFKEPVSFVALYPRANPLALDALSKMLCFDPARRMSCEEALEHPFLKTWRDPSDEPICEKECNFSFEEENHMEGMKALILHEVNLFREEIRAKSKARNAAQLQVVRPPDSLPVPSREEILRSPIHEYGPYPGATSSLAAAHMGEEAHTGSPVIDEPSQDLERELASADSFD
ncbi:kinase-like domain-containing protein [Pholiota molesta]|nr:kinase-like domain-containing protein [Pholiota molesta]